MVAEAVMRVPRRGVGKLLRATSAGVVLLALTACTARVPPDPNQPQVDVLGSMMASEAETNTIMGTIDTIRPKTALRAPMKNDLFEPLSRPECIVAIGNAMDWVYRDSGYRRFRETQFADEAGLVEVDQAITAFDSPQAARVLVTRTVDIWRRCGAGTLTLSYDRGQTLKSRLMAVPSVVDGIDLTRDAPGSGTGFITHRAIVAVDNMVVDLRVSDTSADDSKTLQLAKTIANRNAL